MKRTWKKLFAFVCAFTFVATPATFNGVSLWSGTDGTIVSAADNSTDYTITIPATLSVANAGWNATDGITAKVKDGDTFDTSKKLTVTATSTNSWALKSGENYIGYNLATKSGTYSSSAEPVSWEFSADDLNAAGAAPKGMGIIVDDYSSKPAGNYSDTVTFTASVESAKPEYVDQLSAGYLVTENVINTYWWAINIFAQVGFTSRGSSSVWNAQTITEQQAVALAKYKGTTSLVVYEKGEGSEDSHGLKRVLWKMAKSDGTIVEIDDGINIHEYPDILKDYTVYYVLPISAD